MNPAKANAVEPVIRGDRYRQTHKASVIGILGVKAPVVSSRGSRFFNRDRWVVRFLTSEMCKWARANPGCIPTRDHIKMWVNLANSQQVYNPEIVIANTPDQLPLRVALALTGGAYHEALHTLLSRRDDLVVEDVARIVLPRWARVKDWSRYHNTLLDWSNIIEDIRIERRGREEFEAIFVKMCDLQDLILDMEEKGEQEIRSHGGKPRALSVVAGVFRDVGLGYNTEKQRAAMERYRAANPQAVDLVLSGPLSPLLREAIDLGRSDDLGCLRVAMDVIAVLADLSSENQDPDEQGKDGTSGDGKHRCPSCGAEGDKLVVRPKPDGNGGKVKGIGIVTCTVCGWQEEVPVQPKSKGDKGKGDKGKGKSPRFEDFDDNDMDPSDDKGGGGKGDKDKKDGKSDKGGGDKGDQGGKGDKGQDGSSGGDKGDKDGDRGSGGEDGEDGDKDGDRSDGADGSGGSDDKGDQKGDKGDQKGDKGDQKGDKGDKGDSGEGGGGAGGHEYKDRADGNDDWSQVADEAADQDGLGLLDNNTALEGAVGTAMDKEDRDVETGEAPWAPYDPSLDTAELVKPSSRGREDDTKRADELIKSVKKETAYLRARLRAVIRALEMSSTEHGVPKGRVLSSKYIVDTRAAVMAKDQPKRAYDQKGIELDLSFAAVVIVDESGSMSSLRKDVTRIFCAVTEPFDGLGCATMAMGFRDGYRSSNPGPDDTRHYHRTEAVHYDIFKNWNERFSAVRWRFANTVACGGTPMADGIQYALDQLSRRDEANRVIFVVTDGVPNWGHELIIRRQIRLAREAGIYIIGVGLGYSSKAVLKLFDDSIYADRVAEIPKLIVAKLNQIVDSYGTKRGRRVKKTT